MIKDYLTELLQGIKTYDARAYDTEKRGTIALVDSKTLKVYGLVDLVSTHTITAKDYADWHRTGKYKDLIYTGDPDQIYYAYVFENPRYLASPFKVERQASRTWVTLPDNVNLSTVEPLF